MGFTNVAVDANRPVDTNSVKNNAIPLRTINLTEAASAGAGALLTSNGAAVVWARASSPGSPGTTVTVS